MRLGVMLSGIVLYSALYAPVPLLPALERLFGAPVGSAGLGISLPFVALVLLSPLVPRLRLPAGYLLGGGLFLVGLFGVLAALSASLTSWTFMRILQGAAVALVPALSLALIPKLFPGRPHEMAGLWVAANVVGGGVGRGLAGVLADRLGVEQALILLSLPPMALSVLFFRERASFSLAVPRYSLSAWRLYFIGLALLFINFFVANLLPYRLEALGLSQAQIGGVFFAYFAGIPGSAFAGILSRRIGEARAVRLALLVVMAGILVQATPNPLVILAGFALMMGALFTAQAVAGGASGRQGAGVSGAYVAAFYLGGVLAGLVYPPFLHAGIWWSVALALAVTLAALSMTRAALQGRPSPTNTVSR
ncbi:MAG: MFS transporter [Acidobacteria bacterium]|nr:MFS transporter [Acidobacteriota bacterium]